MRMVWFALTDLRGHDSHGPCDYVCESNYHHNWLIPTFRLQSLIANTTKSMHEPVYEYRSWFLSFGVSIHHSSLSGLTKVINYVNKNSVPKRGLEYCVEKGELRSYENCRSARWQLASRRRRPFKAVIEKHKKTISIDLEKFPIQYAWIQNLFNQDEISLQSPTGCLIKPN